MADAGPPQRPPFNDPHDPRWYSDPASRGPGAGTAGAGSSAVGPSGPPGYAPQQHPPQYGAFAPAEPRGLSITALALGAAAVFTGGLLVVPQILAVVFGHIALRREPAGKPLALTGLILGYVMVLAAVVVVVAFVGLIAASTTFSVPGGP